jgi:hypothetical protein
MEATELLTLVVVVVELVVVMELNLLEATAVLELYT